ncbi:hypothetical protein SODALDRAFT_148372 [Sodiomyces alkalinus F11]|uniref:Uncharacterized protein n=1 Tax=Sodiomyces alkalinus (strain CBS 110278 / VKM F-3762 / F11) TaxID=1314773 RepID=A0A3N2PWM3_SODAK|nr:hypothetical protein SODALDRAFT_148372 [Sodiomyces alkalinus F11]ROT38907.1 hypothetical protein SODALDRAFT_148372 [Sodiomyces alkalinus F11]
MAPRNRCSVLGALAHDLVFKRYQALGARHLGSLPYELGTVRGETWLQGSLYGETQGLECSLPGSFCIPTINALNCLRQSSTFNE